MSAGGLFSSSSALFSSPEFLALEDSDLLPGINFDQASLAPFPDLRGSFIFSHLTSLVNSTLPVRSECQKYEGLPTKSWGPETSKVKHILLQHRWQRLGKWLCSWQLWGLLGFLYHLFSSPLDSQVELIQKPSNSPDYRVGTRFSSFSQRGRCDFCDMMQTYSQIFLFVNFASYSKIENSVQIEFAKSC